MTKPPAFQFYADDFLAGTQKFTDAEAGLYIRLLCAQWNEGGLPDDDEELASYGKGKTPIARIKSKFVRGEDGLLRQPRMEIEREKQRIYRESRVSNGKHGGRPKKPQGNHMVSQMEAQESSPSPSPSPSPIEEEGAIAPVPKFKKPTLDDIFLQSDKAGLPRPEAQRFFNYYESNGWKVGRNPMRSIPHALANWRMKWEETRNGSTNGRTAEKRIDRSIGTANEGIAHEYEGLGNMAPMRS